MRQADKHIDDNGRRLTERFKEHGTIDGPSYVLQHAKLTGCRPVGLRNLKILQHQVTENSRVNRH